MTNNDDPRAFGEETAGAEYDEGTASVTAESPEAAIVRVEIERRRQYTEQRWEALNFLAQDFSDLAPIADRAFIYVTGSMARGEATEGSDLDLFVVDCLGQSGECSPSNAACDHLNYVETARLVAHLDDVRDDAEFRPFSRGGQFIRTHHLNRIVELTGDPQDDAENAFTARILLLINSRPLWNQAAYDVARSRILDHYWAMQQPDENFHPIMLMNDLRRWWSVVCLNFERFNRRQPMEDGTAVSPRERRLANLKLRYARAMAAFSPILALIDVSDTDGRVSRASVEHILRLSPVERLEEIQGAHQARELTVSLVDRVLDAYDAYLTFMKLPTDDQEQIVSIDSEWRVIKGDAYTFHESFVALYRAVGEGRLLYEYSLI